MSSLISDKEFLPAYFFAYECSLLLVSGKVSYPDRGNCTLNVWKIVSITHVKDLHSHRLIDNKK